MDIKSKKCPKCGEPMIMCYEQGDPKPFYCCPMCWYDMKEASNEKRNISKNVNRI